MAMIKKLTRKHRLPRWMRRLLGIKERRPRPSDLLANLDEMHEVPVELPTLFFVCPCCGARSPMGTTTTTTRPDGYAIAQTIIDEVPQQTDFQEKAIKWLKEADPNRPEYVYKIAAHYMEKLQDMPKIHKL